MKLSIFLPHFNRSALLFKTLTVYNHLLAGAGIDYELLVADDHSCLSEVRALLSMVSHNHRTVVHRVTRSHTGSQAVIALNELAEQATGDRFILTGAETFPANTAFLDCLHRVKPGEYIVGSVWALSPTATMKLLSLPVEHHPDPDYITTVDAGRGEWYQHSVHRDRQLHFFSMIHRNDWFKVGGAPRDYENSVGKDDDALLKNIKAAGIKVVSDDSVLAYHQNHYGGLYRDGHDPFRKWGI